MRRYRTHCRVLNVRQSMAQHLFIAALGLWGSGLPSLLAATVTWDGDTSTNWSDGANWDTGSAPGSGDTACFNAATTYQPALTASTTILDIEFDTAGWSLAGGTGITLTVSRTGTSPLVYSYGSGTNTITTALNFSGSSSPRFCPASTNTLRILGNVTSVGNAPSVTGGGTLYFGGSVNRTLRAADGLSPGTLTVLAGSTNQGFNIGSGAQYSRLAVDGAERTVNILATAANSWAVCSLGDAEERYNGNMNGTFSASGNSSSSYRINKVGSSTYTLTGFTKGTSGTGPFNVNDGALVVGNQSTADGMAGTGVGTVTVNGGKLGVASNVILNKTFTFTSGKIGGDGAFGTAVTVPVAGALDPGFGIGRTTFTNGLTINGTNIWKLGALKDDASGGAPGVDFDQVTVSNGTSLAIGAGATLTLRFLSGTTPSLEPFWRVSRSWTMIDGPTGGTARFTDARIDNVWTNFGRFTNSVVDGNVILRWVSAYKPKGTVFRIR